MTHLLLTPFHNISMMVFSLEKLLIEQIDKQTTWYKRKWIKVILLANCQELSITLMESLETLQMICRQSTGVTLYKRLCWNLYYVNFSTDYYCTVHAIMTTNEKDVTLAWAFIINHIHLQGRIYHSYSNIYMIQDIHEIWSKYVCWKKLSITNNLYDLITIIKCDCMNT